MGTIGELIRANSELLYKLNGLGIKNIQTALDYIQIKNVYDSLDYIKSKTERRKRVAEILQISKRTVDSALLIYNKKDA